MATLFIDWKILFAGGFGNLTAELFDPATGTFSATGSMSADRDSATATLLNNGMVLIAGGEDYGGDALISAEVYDPCQWDFYCHRWPYDELSDCTHWLRCSAAERC